ncbi:MAG: DUF2336 domain-containing protein [Pseudomonadota bacterium]
MAQAAAQHAQGHPFASDRIEPGFDGASVDDTGAQDAVGELTSQSANRTEAIIRAATDAFVAPRRRSPQEITVYAQLVRPLMPKVGRETLRWMSAVLAGCEFAPSETCRTLANQSISIAAPILATATKLSVNDQIAIAIQKSEDHRTLLAQRRDLSALVIEEIIGKGESEPVRHLLRNKPRAMTETQSRTALGIIASAMGEDVAARQAATTLANPSIANDRSQTGTSTLSGVENRAEQMAEMRSDLQRRTSALEKARNDLLALAQRANGHDVRTPSRRGVAAPTMPAAQALKQAAGNLEVRPTKTPPRPLAPSSSVAMDKVATDMTELPAVSAAPALVTTLPKQTVGSPKMPRAKSAKPESHPLAKAAGSLDRNILQRELEKTLGLSPVKVSKMMAEPGLEALCVALRAVETHPPLAHKLLTAVHMTARRDMRIVERLRIAYANLDPADCRKALDEWQRNDPIAKAAPVNSHAVPTDGLRGRVSQTVLTDEDLFEPEVPVADKA